MRIPFRRARFVVWFYNLKVGRRRAQVVRELRAILAERPHVLGVCEAIGYRLPQVPGYRLLRNTSTPGRANVAAYVRDDVPASQVRWHDCTVEWQRWKFPGMHPARAWLEFLAGGVQVLVGHQPPKAIKDARGAWVADEAQAEGIHLLTKRMAPWKRDPERKRGRQRPRVAVADFNRHPHEQGPGPSRLAERISGRVVGAGIDVAVTRRAGIRRVRYLPAVNGVEFESDHPDALRFTMLVGRRWLA